MREIIKAFLICMSVVAPVLAFFIWVLGTALKN